MVTYLDINFGCMANVSCGNDKNHINGIVTFPGIVLGVQRLCKSCTRRRALKPKEYVGKNKYL